MDTAKHSRRAGGLLVMAVTGALALGTAHPAHAEPAEYRYSLEGSSFIKKANGTLALKGSVDMTLDPATGAVTGDLTLEPTTLRFSLMDALPVRADLEFAPVGRTTGTLTGGVLTTRTQVVVKMPKVRILGVPIGGGEACESATPAFIKQTSAGASFDPAAGGTLKGVYTLPGFTDCGRYNDLISGFASGPDNTVEETLTPAQG